MVRAKKLWRVVKALPPQEWAPMKEAWQRAERWIGSNLWDMQHSLRQDFLHGRLVMAVRRIAKDDTETCIILERECWQCLKIHYAWSIVGWEEIPGWKAELEAEARKCEHAALVVRRRELDEHYPAATAATPIEHHARRKSKPHADEVTALPPPSTPSAPSSSPPPTGDKPERRRSREQEACRQFADRKWPDGWGTIRTGTIMKAAEKDKDFNKKVDPFPERTTWQRALGRRKG